jgi:hypothetical protein
MVGKQWTLPWLSWCAYQALHMSNGVEDTQILIRSKIGRHPADGKRFKLSVPDLSFS